MNLDRRTVENWAHDVGLAALGFLLGVFYYGSQVRDIIIDAQLTLIAGKSVVGPIGTLHQTLMWSGTAVAVLSLGTWAFLHARRRKERETA